VDPARTIDLNADVGEAGDDAGRAVERGLLELVTSAHVACGGHAGDQASMQATVAAALAAGVRVGAHPSYPDRAGFGRRPVAMAAAALSDSLRQQIGDLADVARSWGTTVQSVKAHGALYAEVARGDAMFGALVDAVYAVCAADTALVLPSGTPAVAVARAAGMPVLEEGFCDRAYTAAGALAPRAQAGAVYDDPAAAAAQALGLARHGSVLAGDGIELLLHVDTLCLHGDSPNALAMAGAVRRALEGDGMAVLAATAPQP
jgi:UPF0271 protein